jgi:resuscitation-promoting factor RpfB
VATSIRKAPLAKAGATVSGLVACLLLLLVACANRVPEFAGPRSATVVLFVDGQSDSIVTEATTVRELLAEAGVELGDSDEVTPPLFTPLVDGLTIRVVRISESIEMIEQLIPFGRKIVRNEAMSANDPPRIVQGGKTGLQHLTVRIVYRDGLESDRQETQRTIMEPAQDEIVMIGVGATRGNLMFAGMLAYISGGNTILLRGNTAVPEQLNTGADLNNRVFSLSPTGSHLLYTRATTETDSFNALWVISTARGAEPRPLNITNVLWADWNPARTELLQIAYTTGKPVDRLPGWEANNDLWVGDVLQNEEAAFNARQLVEAYPATYGWWGGNLAWSPHGRLIAYSYADEVGVIDTQAGREDPSRVRLQRFTEYNTRSDWVWVPSLSWSPDGRYIAFSRPDNPPTAANESDTARFDTWAIDITTGVSGLFVEQAGMWGHPHWSPPVHTEATHETNTSQIAFLRATNPFDSQRSSYTLWLMDRDGSNARQLFPAAGENSRFALDQRSMAWGPSGHDIAFVYNNALYLLNLISGEAHRVTQDDTVIRNPSWAPYGQAIPAQVEASQIVPILTPQATSSPLRPPEE